MMTDNELMAKAAYWKNEECKRRHEIGIFHAAVTKVRDGTVADADNKENDPTWRAACSHYSGRLTAALDAALAQQDAAPLLRFSRRDAWVSLFDRIEKLEFEQDLTIEEIRDVLWQSYADALADVPPRPGLVSADVAKVRDALVKDADRYLELFEKRYAEREDASNWMQAHADDLTALIAAAGDPVPSVPVSLVEPLIKHVELMLDYPFYFDRSDIYYDDTGSRNVTDENWGYN